jgi:TonB family protein
MYRLVSSLLLLLVPVASGSSQVAAAPIEISESSVQALLIRRVAPMYPPLARQARIQGSVILKIVINKGGDVRDVQLYSGHPMLAPAAIEAVMQWKYQPYSKDGEVVEISTMVRVNFNIAGDPPAPAGAVGEGPVIGTGATGLSGDVRASEAEMRAQRIQQIDPVYPPGAIQEKVQGPVVLDVQVSPAGDVRNVMVVSGDPILTAAAIEAVKQWRYRPFVVNGNPVAVVGMVRLHFTLTENDTVGFVREPAPLQAMTPASVEGTAPKIAFPTRVRISSGVRQGLLITKVVPEYPEEARQAQTQGTVILRVRIDKEGNVVNLELVSGHPMLAPAAIEAVRQWKYRPYLLNGTAVEVDTEVRVNFVLE